jgi:hypothetical protein
MQALEASLDALGWIDEISVSERSGTLLTDGHARLELAIARGIQEVPVRYLRLTEEQEREALLYKDPITALATTDSTRLAALVQETRTDSASLREMLDGLANLPLGDVSFVGGGADDVPLDASEAPADLGSHVRMYQLFYSAAIYPEVMTLLADLRTRWDLGTPSDVVLEALHRADRTPD